MEEDNKNNKIKLIASVIMIVAVIAVVFMFFNMIMSGDVVEEKSPEQIAEEEKQREQEIVYDYINVIYTDNGFVPPVVMSSESKINFKNRTSDSIQLELTGDDGEFDETIEIDSESEETQEFSPGEYTATVTETEEQINIRIEN